MSRLMIKLRWLRDDIIREMSSLSGIQIVLIILVAGMFYLTCAYMQWN